MFYCAYESGLGGAGMLLVVSWVDKVTIVQRISDNILLLKLTIGKAVSTFFSMYAPQTNLLEVLKERFYDQLQSAVPKVPANETPIPVGDFNVLEFDAANGLCVSNTWFKRRDSHLLTYIFDSHSTQLEKYFIIRVSPA